MRASVWYQTKVLVQRYIRTITHDKKRIAMILLFPLAIALVINWVAGENMMKYFTETQACLFMVVCSTIFVGVCNAIQEVCKERNIVKREYMANLSLVAYVMSKMIVQGLISAIEVVISGVVYIIAFDTPAEALDESCDALSSVLLPTNLELLLSLFFIMLASNAIGILISSLVKTGDAANTIAPYLLIVQIVFSGVLFPMEGAMDAFASLMVSKWGMGLLAITYQLEKVTIFSEQMADMSPLMPFEFDVPGIYEISSGNILLYWLIMLAFVAVCMAASMIVLRNVSKDTR